MNTGLSVVVAGGGTAGHISPMLAIADAVRSREPGAEVVAVGTASGMETRLVPAAGYELEFIDRVPLPRRPSADLLRLPLRFRSAVKQGREILRRHRADVLVGVGGYVCTPMYIAASLEKVPVVIHEANRRPGIANRVGAVRAAAVATAFPDTPIKGARHVGMPMREGVSGADRAADREQARRKLGLDPQAPVVVVTGGSSGAANMNRTIAAVVGTDAWRESGVQMLHVTGRGKELTDAAGAPLVAPGYRQVSYVDGMEDVYAACDLLVARSGAATVSEVAAVGVPAVFVPLPVGNGEQALNASELVAAEAALLVEDVRFTPDWFLGQALPLVQDGPRLERMAAAARAQGIRDAAGTMADLTIETAHRAARTAPEGR